MELGAGRPFRGTLSCALVVDVVGRARVVVMVKRVERVKSSRCMIGIMLIECRLRFDEFIQENRGVVMPMQEQEN